MILRPKTLEEMPKLLRKAEAKLVAHGKQLKSIIMVGRHDSEATDRIALSYENHESGKRRLHKAWEEHGAVVIHIPHNWTPEGFWGKVRREKIPVEKIQETARKIPHDHDIINYLNQNGFSHLPFVNFHATQSAIKNLPVKSHGLGTLRYLPGSKINRLEYFEPNNPKAPLNALTVEWDIYLKEKLKRNVNTQQEKQLQGLPVHGQLSQHYLTTQHPRAGYESIKKFQDYRTKNTSVTLSESFKQTLAHLAKTGLKK